MRVLLASIIARVTSKVLGRAGRDLRWRLLWGKSEVYGPEGTLPDIDGRRHKPTVGQHIEAGPDRSSAADFRVAKIPGSGPAKYCGYRLCNCGAQHSGIIAIGFHAPYRLIAPIKDEFPVCRIPGIKAATI